MDIYLTIHEVKEESIEKINISNAYLTKADILFDSEDKKDMASVTSAIIELSGEIEDICLESLKKIAEWKKMPSTKNGIYRKVVVEMVKNGIIFRKAIFPDAFILDYKEFFSKDGKDTFNLKLKQKADKYQNIKIEGNIKYIQPKEEE